MIFTASRGKAFREEFTFKNDRGQLISAPVGEYVVTLERGSFVRTFTALTRSNTTIYWNITADDTEALPFNSLAFKLTWNGQPIASGVLRVN